RVVHVARSVLEAQDVPRLRHMGEQWVVAQMLAMMRVEPAEGPSDLSARADHGAIHVDRQSRKTPGAEGLDDEIMIELHERRERRLRELCEPVTDGPRRRQAGQAAEPRHQRIADEILQMLKTAGANVEQADHQQRQTRAAVVTRDRSQRGPQTRDNRQLPEVATHKLQATVRREALRHELDGQIALDHLPQAPYLQAHQRGLLESWDDVGTSLPSMRGQAPLMHFARDFVHSRISDQG